MRKPLNITEYNILLKLVSVMLPLPLPLVYIITFQLR